MKMIVPAAPVKSKSLLMRSAAGLVYRTELPSVFRTALRHVLGFIANTWSGPNKTPPQYAATYIKCAAALWLFSAMASAAELSDWQRINSQQLGYALQYKVYQADGYQAGDPTLYVTDGALYLKYGQLTEILAAEVAAKRVRPLLLVLVDSRNPDDLSENRRHKQFMCNKDYAGFYRDELIPHIQQQYKPAAAREQRVMLGLSFGAVNAACFGLMLPQQFGGLAMQSPGNSEHIKLLIKLYKEMPLLPLKLSLSFGTRNDNLGAGRKFHRTLQQLGYPVQYQEVPFGHDFRNWQPLLDDVLQYFFPAMQPAKPYETSDPAGAQNALKAVTH